MAHITDEALQFMTAHNSSCYLVKMADADKILRGSIGISRRDALALADKWVLAIAAAATLDDAAARKVAPNTPHNQTRLFPVTAVGRLRGSIKLNTGAYTRVQGIGTYTHTTDVYYCGQCGWIAPNATTPCPYAPRRQAEKPTCRICGEPLTTPTERKFGICLECRKRDVNSRHGYHEWHERPRFTNSDKRDKILHLGYELEVHSNRDGYTYGDNEKISAWTKSIGETINIDPWRPFWHLERDGSLNGGGCECISEPLTLAAHFNSSDRVQAAMTAAAADGYVNEHSGLHIHIDRAFFEGHDRYASLKLSYMLATWRDKFDAISGRNGNRSYNRITTIEKNDDPITALEKMNGRCSHDCVLNLSNSGTIEWRLWASTLDADVLKMYLDVTHAAAVLAKTITYDKLAAADFEILARTLRDRKTIDTMKARGLDAATVSKLYKTYDRSHRRSRKQAAAAADTNATATTTAAANSGAQA